MPAMTSCSNIEKVPGAWSFENGQGGPAQVDGATAVTILSGDGSFVATGDHAGEFVSGTAIGDTVFELRADANMDPVVRDEIVETVTLSVTAAGAARFSAISFGTPVPK